MAIDIKTAEALLGIIMRHHSAVAASAFDIGLTEAQRTEAVIKAEAVRSTAEAIIKAIAPSSLAEDKYLAKLKTAVQTNYIKIMAGEWFNE